MHKVTSTHAEQLPLLFEKVKKRAKKERNEIIRKILEENYLAFRYAMTKPEPIVEPRDTNQSIGLYKTHVEVLLKEAKLKDQLIEELKLELAAAKKTQEELQQNIDALTQTIDSIDIL